MTNTQSVENYLKVICHLSGSGHTPVTTNSLAGAMNIKAASISDMMKKLAARKFIKHTPYKGVTLTESGKKTAMQIIRKHRLWELFLTQTLEFKWDEVHHIAEQMEHIESDELIRRIDKYLGYPKFDPHGDPIPDGKGRLPMRKYISLAEFAAGQGGRVMGVQNHTPEYLRHLVLLGIKIGDNIRVVSKSDYDKSLKLKISNGKHIFITHGVATDLLITKTN